MAEALIETFERLGLDITETHVGLAVRTGHFHGDARFALNIAEKFKGALGPNSRVPVDMLYVFSRGGFKDTNHTPIAKQVNL